MAGRRSPFQEEEGSVLASKKEDIQEDVRSWRRSSLSSDKIVPRLN